MAHANRACLIATFCEDRILFGAIGLTAMAWRRSTGSSGVVREYFAAQPRAVAEKYFWKNWVAAYKWIKREPSQPAGS